MTVIFKIWPNISRLVHESRQLFVYAIVPYIFVLYQLHVISVHLIYKDPMCINRALQDIFKNYKARKMRLPLQ